MSRNSMTRITYLSATLAISLVSHAVIAATDSDPNVRRRVVRFADLDIAHTAGAAVLYARIASAARKICEPDIGELRSQWLDVVSRQCQTQAIARAVGDVNAPPLSAYYQMKSQSAR